MTRMLSFTGYAAIFNHPDKYDEIFTKDAFTGWLEKDVSASIPLLFCHDLSTSVGTLENIYRTQKGLKVDGQIDSLFLLNISPNELPGLSVGFRTLKKFLCKSERYVIIHDADLFEISICERGDQIQELAFIERTWYDEVS